MNCAGVGGVRWKLRMESHRAKRSKELVEALWRGCDNRTGGQTKKSIHVIDIRLDPRWRRRHSHHHCRQQEVGILDPNIEVRILYENRQVGKKIGGQALLLLLLSLSLTHMHTYPSHLQMSLERNYSDWDSHSQLQGRDTLHF